MTTTDNDLNDATADEVGLAVSDADGAPRYRSGAVARMVRMPVATLRIWERRYRVAAPSATASGHRLYSAADVQRLALLKQLTDLGHAIGSIASLGMAQLQEVARTHVSTIAAPRGVVAVPRAAWRIAVVGASLGQRLQRPGLLRRIGHGVELIGPFDSLDQAVTAVRGQPLDALLLHSAGLHDEDLPGIEAAVRALGPARVGMFYSFAAEQVHTDFAASGVELLREPQADAATALWLHDLCDRSPVRGPQAGELHGAALEPVPPRRYDDATLADFAGISSTIACECPRHVAELLMQLTQFEAYSAECENRSPTDAALHAYLRHVAGSARSIFETALERVAIHEGLMLPN